MSENHEMQSNRQVHKLQEKEQTKTLQKVQDTQETKREMKFIRGLFTPFDGALLHLTLMGVPPMLGLLPTGLLQNRLGLPPPCSMFEHSLSDYECTDLEDFAIKDLGYRFIVHYELSLVTCFVIKALGGAEIFKENEFRRFNVLLALTSTLAVLGISYIQMADNFAKLEASLFGKVVFFRLLGIFVSIITTLRRETKPTAHAPWSIPGVALFVGAAANFFIVVASLQMAYSGGLEKYFEAEPASITPIVRTCFYMGNLNTAINAIVMLSLRDWLSSSEMKVICGYKFLVQILLPYFWWPERLGFLRVNLLAVEEGRIFLAVVYLCGFLFAGVFSRELDKVSKILTGYPPDTAEKAE